MFNYSFKGFCLANVQTNLMPNSIFIHDKSTNEPVQNLICTIWMILKLHKWETKLFSPKLFFDNAALPWAEIEQKLLIFCK